MGLADRPEGFYKGILDHMLEGCQILGKDWRYLYLNDAAQTHNRRPNGELLGQVYADMWPGVAGTEVYKALRRCLELGEPAAMENEFVFPDGAKGCFELRISPVPEGVFIMSLDVTERRATEKALRQAEEQLRQSQKLEAIGQLAGGIAHDFNNILGVILGHAEMAMDRARRQEPVYEDLEEIHRAAQRSADLTRQLLAFARRQNIEPRVIDLNEVISEFLGFLRRLVGEDINLDWFPRDDAHTVKMDPSQVEQILSNLCVNARDAIPGVGAITIETRNVVVDSAYCADHPEFLPGEFVLLAVSDNGDGMTREVQERIFEPFFTTKELGRGTGLGLSTVYGIVKQNGGFINVYSEPGNGTTIKIYLARDPGAPSAVAPSAGGMITGRGSETILMVEDEPSIRNTTRAMLESLGYRVLVARSPGEAVTVAQAHANEIHLLFTDVIMPDMTGPTLADHVQAVSPATRVLFTSGYTANVIAVRGVFKPGVQFLPKPFSRKALGDKIREVLAAGRPAGGHGAPGVEMR
jgi:two-component system, cell cycle sensor histidine kinase and response regulator CckA